MAGVILQQPNYFGIVEDFTGVADAVHEQKGILVINANPSDLAVLKTPGEWGADVAVGEGQSLGIPMTFGGPGVGYMACTEKLIRKMPGRIVGQTLDSRGQRCFVLTLQAREQHIRRQKATSNICSNQSLMALYVTIYLAVMGKEETRSPFSVTAPLSITVSCSARAYLKNTPGKTTTACLSIEPYLSASA